MFHYFFFYSGFLVALDDDVRVRNLKFGDFEPENGNDTFSVNVSWTGPAFNVTFRSYDVVYELAGYTTEKPMVEKNVVRQFKFNINVSVKICYYIGFITAF